MLNRADPGYGGSLSPIAGLMCFHRPAYRTGRPLTDAVQAKYRSLINKVTGKKQMPRETHDVG